MRKITRKIYFIILCLTTFILSARGTYYNDRLMIYIDNKISDFRISDDQLATSIPEINNLLKGQGVSSIAQWLPKARPTDRDEERHGGELYSHLRRRDQRVRQARREAAAGAEGRRSCGPRRSRRRRRRSCGRGCTTGPCRRASSTRRR